MRLLLKTILPILVVAFARPGIAADKDASHVYAEIRVIDATTRRGVPLVELETVNHLRFVTDNAGRVAFQEPGLMDREVFFTIRSHGYEMKKDGFGFPGVKIVPRKGAIATVEITRQNVAERLCRLTGEGRFRDSILLGHQKSPNENAIPGLVAGQDSVQAVGYRNRIYWFWGDTNRMSYPLGLFRTCGATTATTFSASDLERGIAFDYFVDKSGFARARMPLPERLEGVIWLDGVCTVPDDEGHEKLVAHYSRRKGLANELEHGIALYDDKQNLFVSAKELPLAEKWRFPHGHPEPFVEDGKKWLLFGLPALNVRVRATLKDLFDPGSYEAFTPAAAQGEDKPSWRWQKTLPPMGSNQEAKSVRSGEQKRFYPTNAADPQERVRLHNGTVRWNEHRKRWILIAGQLGGKSSPLGEVWYAEAEQPTGPFEKAVKIVTHDKQSFYNVCHHAFLDRDGGRTIHFEGTYTADFSGSADRTPRYEYNQILYRLDLNSPALRAARTKK